MSTTVIIDRWIDIDGPEFQKIETPNFIRKIIQVGINGGLIKIDSRGYMYQGTNPIHAELDGKLVGIRFSSKANN
jgi:hypothetical protein